MPPKPSTPPGWIQVGSGPGGLPLWRRRDEPVYVATTDTDQLHFLGAALDRFAHMSPREFTDFITETASTETPPARRVCHSAEGTPTSLLSKVPRPVKPAEE